MFLVVRSVFVCLWIGDALGLPKWLVIGGEMSYDLAINVQLQEFFGGSQIRQTKFEFELSLAELSLRLSWKFLGGIFL